MFRWLVRRSAALALAICYLGNSSQKISTSWRRSGTSSAYFGLDEPLEKSLPKKSGWAVWQRDERLQVFCFLINPALRFFVNRRDKESEGRKGK